MRLFLAVSALASLSCAFAAQDGSVAALFTTVRAATRSGQPDRDVARIVNETRLTEQLDLAVVEQIQTEGAGPETLEALERQRDLSRTLPLPAAALKLFDSPAPPAEPERSRILDKARERALQYIAALPNFLCTETVRRYVDSKGRETWQARDTLTLAVAYSAKGEQYKLLAVNGQPTGKALKSVGGFRSSGEFGGLLNRIFHPESATQFHWERWCNLRGRLTNVFSYQIDREHSKYTVNISAFLKHYHLRSGTRGLVYIDRETNQVMRLTVETDGYPDDSPLLRTSSVMDYDFTDIGGQQFLLPHRVDSRVVLRGRQSRNVMEFTKYSKFSSEATITFEPSEPQP